MSIPYVESTLNLGHVKIIKDPNANNSSNFYAKLKAFRKSLKNVFLLIESNLPIKPTQDLLI